MKAYYEHLIAAMARWQDDHYDGPETVFPDWWYEVQEAVADEIAEDWREPDRTDAVHRAVASEINRQRVERKAAV